MSNAITKSVWGEEYDKSACQQLGLSDDHVICYAANVTTLFHEEVFSEKADDELLNVEEALDLIEQASTTVELPRGFQMVGLCKLGTDGPVHYGLVRVPGTKDQAAAQR